jgi:hypothetical protein
MNWKSQERNRVSQGSKRKASERKWKSPQKEQDEPGKITGRATTRNSQNQEKE